MRIEESETNHAEAREKAEAREQAEEKKTYTAETKSEAQALDSNQQILSSQSRAGFAASLQYIFRSDKASLISDESAQALAQAPTSIYNLYRNTLFETATEILQHDIADQNLSTLIQQNEGRIEQALGAYPLLVESIQPILQAYLGPNLELDSRATEAGRRQAMQEVMDHPVMVARGSKIVTAGQVVSEAQYEMLKQLDLLDIGQPDDRFSVGLFLPLMLLTLFALVYLKIAEPSLLRDAKSIFAISLTALITVVSEYYVMSYSGYACTVAFFSIIVTTFHGFQTGFVLSSLLSVMIALMNFGDSSTLLLLFFVAWVSAAVVWNNRYGGNSVRILTMAILSAALIAFALGLLQRLALSEFLINAVVAASSSALSALVAIGFMPILEAFESKVTPMHLAHLSHQGSPLLRRLFLEAPGTNQHSMMVANLAEAGAEAIGADSLFCRVASYYHDIGKLENPLMFTENQLGINPHDQLTPQESYQAIVNHVEAGLNIGKRYHLPAPILDIIREHHGTTVLYYFYNKACQIAEEKGEDAPNMDDFRYPYRVPQTKEAGIIMLADTLEAAARSLHVSDVDEVRKLSRKLLRQKNEQEQLIRSKLSYAEVEGVLDAFARCYE